MKFTVAALSLALASAASAQLSAIPVVEAIAPKSVSCAGAKELDQCREAPAIAKELVTAFFHYGIFHINQMAAVTSLMAFESLDFQFKRNQNPLNVGQGTANMQSAKFNLLYAKSIPELAPLFEQFTSVDSMTDDEKKSVLDAVLDDKYNFGSGPWFLKTQCPDAMAQLETDPEAGFLSYMRCIVIPMDPIDPVRIQYWNAAKAAFGVKA